MSDQQVLTGETHKWTVQHKHCTFQQGQLPQTDRASAFVVNRV